MKEIKFSMYSHLFETKEKMQNFIDQWELSRQLVKNSGINLKNVPIVPEERSK